MKAGLISAIILAAGESRRMGAQKLLMPLGSSTMLEQAVDNYLGSSAGEIIVVLGHRARELKERLAGRPVRIAVNPDYAGGMSTSIIAGIGSISKEARGIMLGLGDEPFVDSGTIDRLLEEFESNQKGIAVPVCRGRLGHPVIFDIRYRNELLKLTGDAGGKNIIRQNPGDVLEVEVDCEGINRDIDTIESYRASGEEVRED